MGLLREWYRRFLTARHAPGHWRMRGGTIDRRIFRGVVIDNEYRLPERFRDTDVVLDVGAHVGSFALACLRRGAGRVVCCEPDEDNFRLLCHNLAPFAGRVALHRAAVWRSDGEAGGLALHNPLDPRNTGANRIGPEGRPVATVAFDELVRREGRVRLAKLDCEGAEWPILLTASALGHVEELCGEYHLGPFPDLYRAGGLADFSARSLREALEARGFEVELAAAPGSALPLGLFFARRGAG